MNPDKLIEKAVDHGTTMSDQDKAIIVRAYEFAEQAHTGQMRSSGQPYFTHVYATAMNCARFGMDATIITAGLLHDVVEDTDVTAEEIEEHFGAEIRKLVEGVTKIGKIRYHGNERHVESLRKFFISAATDVRVVIIKLADRLHNLLTLKHVRPDKQKRIALESIEIYAQMASRLGMGKLATELQDAAFPFAYPAEYARTKTIFDQQLKGTAATLNRVYRGIVKDVGEANIRVVKIEKRVKGVYSLYKKLLRKNWNIDEVNDVVALRIIMNSVDDCYRILGMVHKHYRPVPGRIKDYIALPKPNGYQSLHTSIFSGDGNRAEIQIRTSEMHQFAEYGIASHHLYKQSGKNRYERDSFNWINELSQLETSAKDKNYSEFLKTLRTDFFSDRIFVLTPKGDVIDLPTGSTVLDFAYSIHSEIGDHTSGAMIHGKFSAIKTELSSNDVVEIIIDKKITPTSKWLTWCTTSIAKKHINTYLSKNEKSIMQKILGKYSPM